MPARPTPLLAILLSFWLTACGGGGGGAPDAAPNSGTPAVPAVPADPAPDDGDAGEVDAGTVDEDARRQAAAATAESAANDCVAVRPFYWEVGDAEGALGGGSVGRTSSGRAVTGDTDMRYASASKWMYAAYVAQRRGGRLQAWDGRMLSMRSGYTHFSGCRAGQTVDACLAYEDNDLFDAAADGHFFYGGAHMQKHASLIGLGSLDAGGLAAAMRAELGDDVAIGMLQARPAGGATGTPSVYANFLRRLLDGRLALGEQLGVDPVCASVDGCPPGEALSGPAPAQETWHYSVGHWVEDDPRLGDGAFSSAGAFGFYPWVTADRSRYGMVARDAGGSEADEANGAGAASARCGRLIRRAWDTGVAQ